MNIDVYKRQRTGYVIEVTDHSEFPRERMKEIDSVLPGTKEPSQRLIVLAAWMKQQYGSTMIQALKTVLPARATVGEKERKSIELLLQDAQTQELAAQMERKHQTARLRLLQELMANRTISWEAATKRLKVPSSVISKLESDGVLKAVSYTHLNNVIRHLCDNAQIVGDQHDRGIDFIFQVAQKIQNCLLYTSRCV